MTTCKVLDLTLPMKIISMQPSVGPRSWKTFTVRQKGRNYFNVNESELSCTEEGDKAMHFFVKNEPPASPDWIQCERCSKWRYLSAANVVAFQHSSFCCNMANDLRGFNGCDASQEDWDKMVDGCTWYFDKKNNEWMIHEDNPNVHTPKQTVERKTIFKSPRKRKTSTKKIHYVNEVEEKKYEGVSLKLKGISELTKMSVSQLKNLIVANGFEWFDCLEKDELRERAIESCTPPSF